MHLSDDDLVHLARSLEAALDADRGRRWDDPPRLYGLIPDSAIAVRAALAVGRRRWISLAAGDPYRFLDTIRVRPDDVDALALVAYGWAFPPERPAIWHGRPSTHPNRIRVRSTTVVTPDRRQCSAIRRRDTGAVVIDANGEGPLLHALVEVWDDDGGPATLPGADPPPAA